MYEKEYLIASSQSTDYQMMHRNEINKLISLNNFIEYINSELPKIKKADIYGDALEWFLWETLRRRPIFKATRN